MLGDALAWLGTLTQAEAVGAFWHMILLEVPRYLLTGGAVALAVWRRPGFGGRHVTRAPEEPAGYADVTVLLPGHNEAGGLRATVDSLRQQTLAPSQIVVVDDGSTDGMSDVAADLRREGLVDIALRTELRSGKSAAANLGLRYATGRYVVIADIDTEFAPDAIECMYREFADPKVGAVAGNLAPRNAMESLTTIVQAIQYLISISMGRTFADSFGILFIVSGAVGMFRRDALVGVAGWEVGPGEDADLTEKLRRAGWRIAFATAAMAYTDVPTTMEALIRQRLRWNRSLVRVRLEKFAVSLRPGQSRFSLSDAFGHIDILVFQALLPFSFTLYVVWLFMAYRGDAPAILLAVAMIYVLFALVTFLFAVIVSGNLRNLRYLPYVPLYSLVSSFILRFVRMAAIADEILRQGSYKDSYVPRRVLDAARKDQS